MSRFLPTWLAAVATISAADWRSIGPWGGSATHVTVDARSPNRIAAASRNAAVFVSENAGLNWRRVAFPRLTGASIEALRFDPADSARMFAAVAEETGEHSGLYVSRDRGETWTRHPAFVGVASFALAFFAKNPAVIAAGTKRGVYVSRDGGETWTAPPTGGPTAVVSLAFDTASPETLYAGTTHLPWKSTDGGATWRSIHEGMLDDSDVFSLHVDSKFPERVYASACSGIYRSTSAGEPWIRAQGIPGTDRRTHVVTEDPQFSSLIYAGTTAGLWKSADAGVSWRKLNGYLIRSLDFHPTDGRIVYLATSDQGILRSTTAALDFSLANDGFAGRPVTRVLEIDAERLAAVVFEMNGSAGLMETADGGRSWRATQGPDGLIDAVTLGGTIYAASRSGLWRPSPGAKAHWQRAALPEPSSITAIESAGVLLVATARAVHTSSDGTKWRSFPLPVAFGRTQRLRGATWGAVVETDTGLWTLDFTSSRWAKVAAAPGRLFGFAAGSRPGEVLAATDTGLYRAAAADPAWRRIRGATPESALADGFFSEVTTDPERPGYLAVAQLGRVFESTDAGASWAATANLLQEVLIRRLTVISGRLFAVSDTAGMFERPVLR